MSRLKALSAPALAAVLLALGSGSAFAQESEYTIDTGVTAWMMTSVALVLFMTIPGIALFYGGMVRKANVLATVMQSFAICCLMAIVWMVIGYSIAFSEGTPFFGGLDYFMLGHLAAGWDQAQSSGIPESVFVMFQMTFAIITPALIAGAFADRMKFGSMLVFMTLWSVLVYAPICHWVWASDGFMYEWGVLDFAGGTVVHINAGVAGLVAAYVIGKRRGWPTAGDFKPHNLVLSVIGASMLWVGWFGFNAGSALAADGRAGMAMLVTMIAAAAGALAWMFVEWAVKGKPSVLGIISGAIAGLVAITPAAGFVLPGPALIIGVASGIICYWAATSLKKALGYDDSLDCFGVHGVGGIVGAVLTGVFATGILSATEENPSGAQGLLEGNFDQFLLQIYAVVITIAYTAVVSFIILKVVDAVMGLRVEEEVERDGLDLALHGEVVN
jgi:Amt family ammonium transporter